MTCSVMLQKDILITTNKNLNVKSLVNLCQLISIYFVKHLLRTILPVKILI